VYRYKGLSQPLSCDGNEHELPPDAKRFDGYFTRLYTTVLVSNAAEPAQVILVFNTKTGCKISSVRRVPLDEGVEQSRKC
jgi:hypothetical protein